MKKLILIIFSILLTVSLIGCNASTSKNQTNQGNTPIKTTEFILGTIVDILIYDEKDGVVVQKVVDRLREIENLMTINREESDLQNLNKNAGSPYKVQEDTYKVLEKAMEYSRISDGRFDLTIGPIIKLWDIGGENSRVPSEVEIKTALELIDYNLVELQGDNTVLLKKQDMVIDLGSIAKGYAADEAVKILKENGVEKAILNLGGNIYALGAKTENDPWKIGIQDPFSDRGGYIGVVSIKDQTVVTSGIYERYFEENGVRYHHIIDPRTGYPVNNEVASVSIVSDSSIDADALSTTVFIMGVAEGMNFIEGLDNTDAIFVTRDNKIHITSGLKDNFVKK